MSPPSPDVTVGLREAIGRVEAHPVRNVQTGAITGYMIPADEWRSIRAQLRRLLAAVPDGSEVPERFTPS